MIQVEILSCCTLLNQWNKVHNIQVVGLHLGLYIVNLRRVKLRLAGASLGSAGFVQDSDAGNTEEILNVRSQ